MWVAPPAATYARSIASTSSCSLAPGTAARCSARTPASVSPAARRVHSIILGGLAQAQPCVVGVEVDRRARGVLQAGEGGVPERADDGD